VHLVGFIIRNGTPILIYIYNVFFTLIEDMPLCLNVAHMFENWSEDGLIKPKHVATIK